MSAYLADLPRAESATSDRLAADTPGMPACNPPPIPAATYPPGAAYGVPFLAAITNGQVLAGYDEWTANHLVWKADKLKFDLYPWQSKIYDITGWVTGLLQLPSLTAEIAPQDVVFCDQGGASCLSADWPAGECIQIEAQYGPSPASKTPPPALGSSHPEGTSCSDYSTPTFECFPYVVSLTPSGTTSLTVSGVQPDGALDATVTTGAVTTVGEVPPPPSTSTFTCQAPPASVTLSTKAGGLPATAPPPPTPPETDYRSLQTPPLPITGPLVGSTSTVASNDFSVPAFFPSATRHSVHCLPGRQPQYLRRRMGFTLQGSGLGSLLREWRHQPDGGRAGVGAVHGHHHRGQRRPTHGATVRVQFLSPAELRFLSTLATKRRKTRWEEKGR